MNALARGTARQYWVALRALLIFTVVLGIAYPAAMTGFAQIAFPVQADGSMLADHSRIIGSSLIGQSFTDKKGNPLPRWFQSRPSAAGVGYDGGSSSGSNLGASNPDLVKAVKQREMLVAKLDGVPSSRIPVDALTASASGLDPHISPANALLQVNTVAKARGITSDAVRRLVESRIQQRDLGYLGEATVNVVQLNLALAHMDPSGNK